MSAHNFPRSPATQPPSGVVGGTSGASANAETGSREPDPQAVPALSGFDPARKASVFRLANAVSPIVRSEWLDEKKRAPKGPPKTWVYYRLTLADGSVFTFDREEKEHLGSWEQCWWSGLERPAIATEAASRDIAQ